ncbi:hypothetical protein BSM4216_3510 [Bacillus smithii]|nr:hypothetical protein BSM4216_3510 [Bacillus smithii]
MGLWQLIDSIFSKKNDERTLLARDPHRHSFLEKINQTANSSQKILSYHWFQTKNYAFLVSPSLYSEKLSMPNFL